MTVYATEPTIPQAVLDAALALHQGKSKDLTLGPFGNADEEPAESNPLWRCVDGQIEFANLEARNHCAALATFQQLKPLSSTDALFDAAYELWLNEIGHPDLASSRLLVFASQTENVLLNVARFMRDKKGRCWDVQHVLANALPHLENICEGDVVTIFDAGADSMIVRAIESRLRSAPLLAWEIWHITRGRMSESMQSLYKTALQALMHTDQQALALEKAREDAEHLDPLIAGGALRTLGRAIQVLQLNEPELGSCIAVLTDKTIAVSTEIQQAAIRAVADASLKDERLMSELLRLASEPDDFTLTVVADFLFTYQFDLHIESPYFMPLLKALARLSPSQTNAIRNFNCVLSSLYATPEHRPWVLDCLSQWVIQHGSSSPHDKTFSRLFEQTIMQIANVKPGLQAVITHWLVAPEKQLAVACADLISYLHISGMKSLAFSPEVLDTFDQQDFKFLARRLLGYVISEGPLLSLTLSLLETNNAPERSYDWVLSLLTEEVGRDYERATMEALKVRQETANSPEKELLAQMHAILQQRSTANDRLPRLHELRPPLRLRRAIALNQARAMERAREAADEKSIARALFTEVSLKAGIACFSVFDNKIGPTQHLQTVSHSVTLPARSFTDPVGYSIAGYLYCKAKREDE